MRKLNVEKYYREREGREREYSEARAKLKEKQPPDEIGMCRTCGNLEAVTSYMLHPRANEYVSKVTCIPCDEKQRKELIQKRLADAGITGPMTEKTFDNYVCENADQKKALEVARDYAQRGGSRWLAFIGNPGTGKGHLTLAIIRQIIEDNTDRRSPSIWYTKHIRLIRKIRSTYGGNAALTEEAVIETMDKFSLLVIDEVGLKGQVSEWEKATLDDILDYRSEHHKALIITSNLSYKELFGILGSRIESRFHERGQVVVCNWEDYRKKKQ